MSVQDIKAQFSHILNKYRSVGHFELRRIFLEALENGKPLKVGVIIQKDHHGLMMS